MAAKLLNIQTGGRQFVDRYELMGEIASGGMATVYLARLTGVGGFQRLFAIKRLHPHLAGEKEFVEMFLDEARLAAGIHHPHVVPILEVGASPGGYYLVMEYIEGETFARLLAKASSSKVPVPAAVVIRIGLDMLAGLHAAHELRDETGAIAGLVHRDVSPQNVLVGSDGVTRITDFGVARAASRLTATRVGQLKGKIAYMAPEQARGDESIDRRADVFAAGIVIWEGLAHRRLFKAENEAATLARVMSEPVPELSEAAPSVPPAIAEVVMKALARDLKLRYATCAEFAEALERAARGAGVLASSRDMQTYLEQVIGPELQEQRNALRLWVAQAEGDPNVPVHQLLTPSAGRQLGSLPGEVSQSQVAPLPVAPRRNWLLQVALLLLLMLLGAAGFLAYKKWIQGSFQEPPRPVPPVAEVEPEPVVPTPPPEPQPEPVPEDPEPEEVPEEPEPEPTSRPPARPPGGSTRPPSVPKTQPTAKPPAKPKDPFDSLNNPYR